jgi:hypothetical protein
MSLLLRSSLPLLSDLVADLSLASTRGLRTRARIRHEEPQGEETGNVPATR